MQMDLRKYTKCWVWGIYTPLFSDSPIVYQSLWIDLETAGHWMQVLLSPMLLDESNSLWPWCLLSWPFYTMAMSQKGPCSIMAVNWEPFPIFRTKHDKTISIIDSWIKSQCFMAKAHNVSSSSMVQIMWNPSNSLWARFWGWFFPIFSHDFTSVKSHVFTIAWVNPLFPSMPGLLVDHLMAQAIQMFLPWRIWSVFPRENPPKTGKSWENLDLDMLDWGKIPNFEADNLIILILDQENH